MAKQILRAIDSWRFEAPLAVMLGFATGFAVTAMPVGLFAQLPVAGAYGAIAQDGIAAIAALLSSAVGYMLMRAPNKPVPADENEAEEAEAEVKAAPISDRLRRVRRADRHPDAPPREPIHASRDLGEPMMEVGLFFQESESDAHPIPAGEFVEVADAAAAADAAEPAFEALAGQLSDDEIDAVVETEPVVEAAPVVDVAAPIIFAAAPVPPAAPAKPGRATPRSERQSLDALIDRLSAGLERRAAGHAAGTTPLPPSPPRDMRPALRDALEELNRLAARRF